MSNLPKASAGKLILLALLVLAGIGVLVYNLTGGGDVKVNDDIQSKADKMAAEMAADSQAPPDVPRDPNAPPSPMRRGGTTKVGG